MSEKVYNIGDFIFLKSDFETWVKYVLDISKDGVEYAGNRIILNYKDEDIYNERLLDLFFEDRSAGKMEDFGTYNMSQKLVTEGCRDTTSQLQALFIRVFFESEIGVYEIKDILSSHKTEGLVFDCSSTTGYCFRGRHVVPHYILSEDILLCEHLVTFIETCFERCKRYAMRQKFRII